MQYLYFLLMKKVSKIKGCHGLGPGWGRLQRDWGIFCGDGATLCLDCSGDNTHSCLSSLMELTDKVNFTLCKVCHIFKTTN